MEQKSFPTPTAETLFASAQASVQFALTCLEPAAHGLRSRSTFVNPFGQIMHWHDFGDLEGPGWAGNAIGGAVLLYSWGIYLGESGTELRRAALQLADHILDDGFIQTDGFIWPYWDMHKQQFTLNYTHNNDWLCPGSLAMVGLQMLELADLIPPAEDAGVRIQRLRQAAERLAGWLETHVPALPNGWLPRRVTRAGQAYPLNPHGDPDSIYDHSADGLYLVALWALTGRRAPALSAGDAFVSAGGLWGSINHDTFDDHENVAYAVAFRLLRRAGQALGRPAWSDFCYHTALPAMRRFRMTHDEHGVPTAGLFWMEASWDTAYLWENAEVARAHLEAWQERGDPTNQEIALGILAAISRHHAGPLGFLSEGIDWNNHVSQRHHLHHDYYGAIHYTEPLLNNLHLVGPTLDYLQAAGFRPPAALLGLPAAVTHLEKATSQYLENILPPSSGTRYLLRLNFPAVETDAGVESVLAFAREAAMDGVLLFETNYDTDPALLRLDVLQERFARLKAITPRFQLAGLDVQINVEISLGHVDDDGCHPEWFDFQFLVNEEGRTSRSTACPLDPAYLDYASQIYRWAAGCGASAVWVDDDVRFVFHDLPGMNCFCPRHLAEMARRTRQDWTPSALAAALADDRQNSVRQAWFDLQEQAVLALAARLEKEIHGVDPRVRIGLMTIGAANHAAEGRYTDRLLRVLAGGRNQPLIRPGAGYYHDWEPAAVLAKTEDVFRQVSFLGRDVQVVAEIENHPYTAFQKANRSLLLELGLNILSGAPELSLNILHNTNPYSHQPGGRLAAALRSGRPFLDALARARSGKVRLGIGVECSEDTARRMPLRGRPLLAWIEPRPWEQLFARLGFPVGQPQNAPHFLSGDVVHAIDPMALESLIQTGAILTPSAVMGLLEMGWGARIGLQELAPAAPGVNEYFSADPLNGLYAGARLHIRHYRSLFHPFRVQPAAGVTARGLSRWVDITGSDQGAAVLALEHADGTRLGVLPFELQSIGTAQMQLARREQWSNLFAWVSRSPLPCRVVEGVNIYPQIFQDRIGGEIPGSSLLVLANLSADDQEVRLEGPALLNRPACQLLESGEWAAVADLARVQAPAWALTALLF